MLEQEAAKFRAHPTLGHSEKCLNDNPRGHYSHVVLGLSYSMTFPLRMVSARWNIRLELS